MDRIVIEGVPGCDGEYELDLGRSFNTREWRWIRKLSEHTPHTIEAAFQDSDPDLLVAFAVIAMCRAGKLPRDGDQWRSTGTELAEVPLDGARLRLVMDAVEEEPFPLALTSTRSDPSPSSVLEKTPSGRREPNSSGATSRNDSERSGRSHPVTTLLRSGTS